MNLFEKMSKLAATLQVDDNGKINRLRRECPAEECGAGVFMAAHHDRQVILDCRLVDCSPPQLLCSSTAQLFFFSSCLLLIFPLSPLSPFHTHSPDKVKGRHTKKKIIDIFGSGLSIIEGSPFSGKPWF